MYEKFKSEDILHSSLMRDVTESMVKGQFNRIAHGGVRLTEFSFGYFFPNKIDRYEVLNPAKLTFDVKPESNPPTNIHVVIGRNGVGKTFLINNLLSTIRKNACKEKTGYFFDIHTNDNFEIRVNNIFSNAICVGFSAFDSLPTKLDDTIIPYIFIGLDNEDYYGTNLSKIEILSKKFEESVEKVFSSKMKKDLWFESLDILKYDIYFEESRILENAKSIEIITEKNSSNPFEKVRKNFERLSSGHKVILLTITKIVQHIEEKSFVILDEPETHLHPPLLSAFVRALSNILIKKNAIALIATHSPIILQEIPSSCAWKMQRSKLEVALNKLNYETFGTNINTLIREVFGLEVTKSGFHKMLDESLEKYNFDYHKVVEEFNNELGDEARAILKMSVEVEKRKYEKN